jgi:hypothetical protein
LIVHQIVDLQIPMCEAFLMHMCNTHKQLTHNLFYEWFRLLFLFF